MFAWMSYFFPCLPIKRQVNSSTDAATTWNLSWFFGKTDSKVLISCFKVFKHAIARIVAHSRLFEKQLLQDQLSRTKMASRTWTTSAQTIDHHWHTRVSSQASNKQESAQLGCRRTPATLTRWHDVHAGEAEVTLLQVTDSAALNVEILVKEFRFGECKFSRRRCFSLWWSPGVYVVVPFWVIIKKMFWVVYQL